MRKFRPASVRSAELAREAKAMAEFYNDGPGALLTGDVPCCLCGELTAPAVPPLTSAVCYRCRLDDQHSGGAYRMTRWTRRRSECCQHAYYISTHWQNLEQCICRACAHRWTVVHP